MNCKYINQRTGKEYNNHEEFLYSLNPEELNQVFAQSMKESTTSFESAFSPTEQIFNESNKASTTLLGNMFVESTEEFYQTIISPELFDETDSKIFEKPTLDIESVYQNVVDLSLRDLISNTHYRDLLRTLGLITVKDKNNTNFNLKSLAEKIKLLKENEHVKEYIKDRDSFLRYIKESVYVNPQKNKYIQEVKYLQPKNGITKNALALDFADALLDIESFANRHKMPMEIAKLIQSVAQDMILYSYGLNNFSFAFGGISKIFNEEVMNHKFDFLNMTISKAFSQNRLKGFANFTQMSALDRFDFQKNLAMINPKLSRSLVYGINEHTGKYDEKGFVKMSTNFFKALNKDVKAKDVKPRVMVSMSNKRPRNLFTYDPNGTEFPRMINYRGDVFIKKEFDHNIFKPYADSSGIDINEIAPNLVMYEVVELQGKASFIDKDRNKVISSTASEIYNMFMDLDDPIFNVRHNRNKISLSGRANKPAEKKFSKFSVDGSILRTEESVIKDSEKLKSIFEKAGIKVNLIYDNEIENKGEAQWISDKEVNIVINLDKATADTSPHEFSHIFADIVGLDNPVMKRAVSFLKGTDLWQEVETMYPELTGDALAKEVISTAMGIAAAKKLNKEELSTWEKIKQGIKAFFKRLFRFNSMNPVDELVEMMYNQDFNAIAGNIVLSNMYPKWLSKSKAEIGELMGKKARKSVEKILADVSSKIGTLKAKDRPYKRIMKDYKSMREEKFVAKNFAQKYTGYMMGISKDIDYLYDNIVSVIASMKTNPENYTTETKKRVYDAIIQLIDDLKTFENASKELTNYFKIDQEFKKLKKINEAKPSSSRQTDVEIIKEHLLIPGSNKFKYEDSEDLLSKIVIKSDEGVWFPNAILEKMNIISNLSLLVEMNNTFDYQRRSLYGNGAFEHGLLREMINEELIKLSTNPDMIDGTITNLFELKKTRYTLPYDETSIQRWLDAMKDTNNPLVALTLKQYFEEQFIASKKSEDEIKEFKEKHKEYLSKGFTIDQLVDQDGRIIDDLNYNAYVKIRYEYEKDGKISDFYRKYHRKHPNYNDIIKEKLTELGGQESPAYREWFERNHVTKTRGNRSKTYPTGELSVPNTDIEEIRNKNFDNLSKNKEWLEYRNYFKNILEKKSKGFNSSLLNEGFLPSVTKNQETLLEQLKKKKDRIFSKNDGEKYVLTDENNNIVLIHDMPYLTWLSKEEIPKFDENAKDIKAEKERYRAEKAKYNLEKRLNQKNLTYNNFEVVMEVFMRAQNNYKFKKSNDSKLILIRELVKDHHLHRNNGTLEAYNKMIKKNTGENVAAKEAPKNLLDHLDNWIRMVHYEDMNFGDGQRWKTELTSLVMNITSYSAMGFNVYSAANNLLHGNLQLAVERYAGQWFSKKSWRRANAIAAKSVFYKNGSDNSKDGAIMNYFDVYADQNELNDHLRDKGFVDKFKDANFYMQNAGEHQLQNTTLFSMLMETPVRIKKDDGSYEDGWLYDNLEMANGKIFWSENVEIKNEKGKWVQLNEQQIARVRNKVISVNQYLYGIYNKEDLGPINQYWYGRLGLHFKKWMRPGINKRFGSRFGQAFWNESREALDEGMYITTLKYLVGIAKKVIGMESDFVNFKELDIHTKRNIWRTQAELASALVLFAISRLLVNLIRGLEPEDDEYLAVYSLHYMLNRLHNEQLTYSFKVRTETKRLLQSPIASVGILKSMLEVVFNLVKLPFNEETLEQIGVKSAYYQGGYKKGESKAAYSFKNLIPGVKTYQQFLYMDDSFEQRISQ